MLATNMAETSITINDVVFVVDCGKAKETSYDALNNTPCLLPSWISKASARQVRFFLSTLIFLISFFADVSARDPIRYFEYFIHIDHYNIWNLESDYVLLVLSC